MIALLITHHSNKVVKVTHFGPEPIWGHRKCYYKWRTKTGKVKTGMAMNYSLYQLDGDSGAGTWQCWNDIGSGRPDWTRDSMLVAMRAAEVRDI